MMRPFRLSTLVEVATRVMPEAAAAADASGRVCWVPTERLVRYYTMLGLIDGPTQMRGRVAFYSARHVLQILAIKRLQLAGADLKTVQERLAGLTDADLERIVGLARGWRKHIAELVEAEAVRAQYEAALLAGLRIAPPARVSAAAPAAAAAQAAAQAPAQVPGQVPAPVPGHTPGQAPGQALGHTPAHTSAQDSAPVAPQADPGAVTAARTADFWATPPAAFAPAGVPPQAATSPVPDAIGSTDSNAQPPWSGVWLEHDVMLLVPPDKLRGLAARRLRRAARSLLRVLGPRRGPGEVSDP